MAKKIKNKYMTRAVEVRQAMLSTKYGGKINKLTCEAVLENMGELVNKKNMDCIKFAMLNCHKNICKYAFIGN